jgi:PAS domain S-box-containing protein
MTQNGQSSINKSNMAFSQNVFDNISETIIIVNSDGVIVKCNKTVRTMFGYTSEELTGNKIEKIVNISNKKMHRKNCEHFFEKSRKRQMGAGLNISARRKDGSIIPVEVGLSSFVSDGEKFVVAIISDVSERKKIEAELNENRKKYEAVFDKANDYFVLLDKNGVVIDVNQRAVIEIGYSRDEIVGSNLLKLPFLMKREIPKLLMHFKNRLMGKKVGTYELHFVKRNGKILLGEINASMIEFEDGSKADLVVIRDITERRKLADEIRQSRDYFINLVNSTLDMIIAVDVSRKIVLFNKAAENAFGYTEQEVLGKHINILYANNAQGLLIHNKLIKSDGFSGEIINMRKNKEIFTSYISSNTLYDENNNIIGFLGVSRDVTESKMAEERLRKSEERQRSILESSSDLIMRVDHMGTIKYINFVYSGLKKEEVIGKTIYDFLSLEYHAVIKKSLNKVFVTGENNSVESRGMGPDNSLRWFNINIGPIKAGHKVVSATLIAIDITEQKLSEEKLKEIEKRWNFALEGTNNGVWDWNIQTNDVFFSVQWKAILGFEDHELSGSREEWDKLVYPEDKEQVDKDILDHVNGITPIYENEHRVLTKDGSYKWVHGRGKIMEWTPDGKPLRMVGTHTDITGRKNDEHEREELLFDFGERVKELNCLYGLSKIASQPNLSLGDMLENVAYLLPLTWQYPEITCARVLVHNTEKKTENYTETEWKLSADIKIHNNKIGEVVIFYTEERPSLYEGPFLEEERHLLDTVAEQVGKIVDHSQHEKERRKLINSLTDKTSELNTILDSVGDAIITTDEKYLITSVNRAFCDMFGCESHTYIGKSCEDLFKCDGEPETETCEDHCGLQSTLDQMEASSNRMTVTTDEGKSIVIQSVTSPLINSEGNVVGAVKSMRDISREAEVERMKNEFVATVSHELRTPLTSIKGYIDLFLDGDTGEINEIQEEFLDIVSKNTDRLTALINDLLDIEKIDAGNISFDKKNIDLGKLVNLAYRTMEPLANEKNLEYIISVADNVHINADQDRIMQVLTNLLSNALKFTQKGSVSIRLKKDNGKAKLIVQDTGIGVSKADQKKMFTKFFRAKEAYKKSIGGTGLGLSIVKSIVELHDGNVTLESVLHKGSVMRVDFPLAKRAKKK